MFRTALFASVIALAAAGAADAGTVGGGVPATIEGGGDDMTIAYATGGAGGGQVVLAQPPRLARARNEADGGIAVEYLVPETARPSREAWLRGGGDDAEVVYRNPR